MANLRTDYEDGELILADFFNETNAKVNSHNTEVVSIRQLVESAEFEQGVVQYADDVYLHSGTGLSSGNVESALGELASEVFPLEVTVGTYTDTYEVGDEITYEIPIAIKRHGEYVDKTATIVVSPNTAHFDTTNHKLVDEGLYPPQAGSISYTVEATQGGQIKSVTAKISTMFYLYAGDIGTSTLETDTAVKNKIESSWRNSNKTLSNATTKGSTPLAASHYYLFAVKSSVSLVVRDAATNGVISGCTTGTVTIERVNESDSDSYSYVIVPASSLAWSFKITNS
jgi:hypothetical protein